MNHFIGVLIPFLAHYFIYNIAVLYWPLCSLMEWEKERKVFKNISLLQLAISLITFSILGYRWFIKNEGNITEMILPFAVGIIFLVIQTTVALYFLATNLYKDFKSS
ncbi:MAG: hypothetical protein MI748_02970 [Opitutales bacterium]|nr:hypothetical protein [Opitutales bacterium]